MHRLPTVLSRNGGAFHRDAIVVRQRHEESAHDSLVVIWKFPYGVNGSERDGDVVSRDERV